MKEHREVWPSVFLPWRSIWGPHWPMHQPLPHTAAPRLVGLSPPLQLASSQPHQTRNTCVFSTFRCRGFTCSNARIVQTLFLLTKVRAHNGHWGNELADAWAKRARRELCDRVQRLWPHGSLRYAAESSGLVSTRARGSIDE